MQPLTILIITFNRLEYTKQTIESLVNSDIPEGTNIIVYDNNSTEPGMREYLDELWGEKSNVCKYPKYNISVMFHHENVGWGTAINRALKEEYGVGLMKEPKKFITTEFILISNNDCVYSPNWYSKCLAAYAKYPQIGVLGVWKHTGHGVKEKKEDLWIKDDMPGVGWLMKRSIIDQVGPFKESGPCSTKGGNGEDSDYTIRTGWKGYWICGLPEDVGVHITGY